MVLAIGWKIRNSDGVVPPAARRVPGGMKIVHSVVNLSPATWRIYRLRVGGIEYTEFTFTPDNSVMADI